MATQRAIEAGIKVVAFDVNVEIEAIPFSGTTDVAFSEM